MSLLAEGLTVVGRLPRGVPEGVFLPVLVRNGLLHGAIP